MLGADVACQNDDGVGEVNSAAGPVRQPTIVKQLRTEDFVARLNDDNFAALLPNTGNREAIGAAKRLGRKIQKMVFSHQSKSFQVSLSIGIATWDGRESAELLFSRSEEALSNAKRAGGAQYWTAQTLQQE